MTITIPAWLLWKIFDVVLLGIGSLIILRYGRWCAEHSEASQLTRYLIGLGVSLLVSLLTTVTNTTPFH